MRYISTVSDSKFFPSEHEVFRIQQNMHHLAYFLGVSGLIAWNILFHSYFSCALNILLRHQQASPVVLMRIPTLRARTVPDFTSWTKFWGNTSCFKGLSVSSDPGVSVLPARVTLAGIVEGRTQVRRVLLVRTGKISFQRARAPT